MSSVLKVYRWEIASLAHKTQLWPSALTHTPLGKPAVFQQAIAVCLLVWSHLCVWETDIFLHVCGNVHNLWSVCGLGVSESIPFAWCRALCEAPGCWRLISFSFPCECLCVDWQNSSPHGNSLGVGALNGSFVFAFPRCVNSVLVSRGW